MVSSRQRWAKQTADDASATGTALMRDIRDVGASCHVLTYPRRGLDALPLPLRAANYLAGRLVESHDEVAVGVVPVAEKTPLEVGDKVLGVLFSARMHQLAKELFVLEGGGGGLGHFPQVAVLCFANGHDDCRGRQEMEMSTRRRKRRCQPAHGQVAGKLEPARH